MESDALDWLARLGSRALSLSLVGFVLVNGAALAALFITRDRTLVNRWTGHLLAANLVLAGAGLGVPLLTSLARLAITAVAPTVRLTPPSDEQPRAEISAPAESPRFGRP